MATNFIKGAPKFDAFYFYHSLFSTIALYTKSKTMSSVIDFCVDIMNPSRFLLSEIKKNLFSTCPEIGKN